MNSFPVETQLVLEELAHSIEQIELVEELYSFVLLRVISRIMPTEAFLDRLDDLWPDQFPHLLKHFVCELYVDFCCLEKLTEDLCCDLFVWLFCDQKVNFIKLLAFSYFIFQMLNYKQRNFDYNLLSL